MKTNLLILALILLTQLDGNPVWVESTAVIAVRPAREHGQCGNVHGAALRVGTIAMCVRETPDQIRRLINEAK